MLHRCKRIKVTSKTIIKHAAFANGGYALILRQIVYERLLEMIKHAAFDIINCYFVRFTTILPFQVQIIFIIF